MRTSRPFRRTTTGDFYDSGGAGQTGVCLGVSLMGGSAAAAAQVTDANGTVIADLAAPANGNHVVPIPMIFVQKLTLAAISGAGAVVNVYVA